MDMGFSESRSTPSPSYVYNPKVVTMAFATLGLWELQCVLYRPVYRTDPALRVSRHNFFFISQKKFPKNCFFDGKKIQPLHRRKKQQLNSPRAPHPRIQSIGGWIEAARGLIREYKESFQRFSRFRVSESLQSAERGSRVVNPPPPPLFFKVLRIERRLRVCGVTTQYFKTGKSIGG